MGDRLKEWWSRIVFPTPLRELLRSIVREEMSTATAVVRADLAGDVTGAAEWLRKEWRQHSDTLRLDIEREVVTGRVTLVDALLRTTAPLARVLEAVRQDTRDVEAAQEHTEFMREHLQSALTTELSACVGRVEALAPTPSNGLKQELLLDTLRRVDDCRQELIRRQLSTRLLLMRALWTAVPPRADGPPIQLELQDFQSILGRLRALHPHLYPTWQRINFVENPREFARRPEGSCSIGKRGTDEPFGGFVAPYLAGRVLDVGCGPYAVPLYLQQYPNELIYGIDPVDPFEPHPFTFVRGFAEFLPFPDASFDVVIAATSLDHALSLDRALSSIRRVIKPGGQFLVWDGFVNGSPRYDPEDPALKPIDDFHFFHFDEGWFEEIMREHDFDVREKLVYDPSPHNPQYCSSYFYCLTAGSTSGAA
jgi:SAM-dependent methyltransferase